MERVAVEAAEDEAADGKEVEESEAGSTEVDMVNADDTKAAGCQRLLGRYGGKRTVQECTIEPMIDLCYGVIVGVEGQQSEAGDGWTNVE